jgi:hypothetical protein
MHDICVQNVNDFHMISITKLWDGKFVMLMFVCSIHPTNLDFIVKKQPTNWEEIQDSNFFLQLTSQTYQLH